MATDGNCTHCDYHRVPSLNLLLCSTNCGSQAEDDCCCCLGNDDEDEDDGVLLISISIFLNGGRK